LCSFGKGTARKRLRLKFGQRWSIRKSVKFYASDPNGKMVPTSGKTGHTPVYDGPWRVALHLIAAQQDVNASMKSEELLDYQGSPRPV